jgi:transcription initiation factor TFIIE subunit alpha
MRSSYTQCMIPGLGQLRQLVAANVHHRLHAEDLAHLLGMQQKDLRKLCARLRDDRLIAVYGPFLHPALTF